MCGYGACRAPLRALYFSRKRVADGVRGYCSEQHRTDHQSVMRYRASAALAQERADRLGPVTPEEVASWDDGLYVES